MSAKPNPAFFNHIVSLINATETVRNVVLNTGPEEVAMIVRNGTLRAAPLAKATVLLHATSAERERVAKVFNADPAFVTVCLIEANGERAGAPDFIALHRSRFATVTALAG